MIQETEEKALVSQALEARKLAYAPYSGYTVGAALLTADGHRYLGGNIENASYGATNCAERTAFFKAVSEGERAFTAIAIAGGISGEASVEYASPCGICRPVMQEFCRDDFKMYRTLEAQLAFYQKQLSELRDNYLIVDTVNDYRSGQAHTVTIETVQQTAYARSKAQTESVILDLTQKLWIIRRTVDLATGCTEAALQAAVAMYIYNGTELDKIARLLFVSRPTVSRYIKRFFELPEVKKLFYQAVEDSKGNLRDLKH